MHVLDRFASRLPRPTPQLVDSVAAAVLVVAAAVEDVVIHQSAAAVVVDLAVAATVALRRRAPVAATLLAVAGAAVLGPLGGRSQIAVPIALGLDFYLLGRRSGEHGWRRLDVALLLVPLPVLAVSPTTTLAGAPRAVAVIWTWGFFLAAPFVAGRMIGTRTRLTTRLRANTQQLVAEQHARARRAATEERLRIARELHDVLAHSVSVMVIQTAAAREVARADRDAAHEALRAVESCGRDALIDLRRMVGALHSDSGAGVLGGASPGLAELAGLAERARASGLPVQVRVEGERRQLSADLELVSYRVVQEALTNVLKHAGPSPTRVRVIFTATGLELEITDTGVQPARQPAPGGDRNGQGLVGMRERLALYGGTLSAGPHPDGGFQVHARLPLPAAVPA